MPMENRILTNEREEQEERDMAVKMLWVGLAENTSMHAIPNIYRSKGPWRKVFWSVICLGALCEYFEYLYF